MPRKICSRCKKDYPDQCDAKKRYGCQFGDYDSDDSDGSGYYCKGLGLPGSGHEGLYAIVEVPTEAEERAAAERRAAEGRAAAERRAAEERAAAERRAAHLATTKPLAELSSSEIEKLILGIDSLSGHAGTLMSNSVSGEIMTMLDSAEDLKDFGLPGVHAKLLFGKIAGWKKTGVALSEFSRGDEDDDDDDNNWTDADDEDDEDDEE